MDGVTVAQRLALMMAIKENIRAKRWDMMVRVGRSWWARHSRKKRHGPSQDANEAEPGVVQGVVASQGQQQQMPEQQSESGEGEDAVAEEAVEAGGIPQQQAEQVPAAAERPLRLATWNVHSITEKRGAVEELLRWEKVDILCMQETWRTAEEWPVRQAGFHVFEERARRQQEGEGAPQRIPGQLGLAVYVRKGIPVFESGDSSPYHQTVVICLGMVRWTIINVYIPGLTTPNRRGAIQTVKHAVCRVLQLDPNARLVITGDWNENPTRVAHRISRWHPLLDLVPCQGKPQTFRARGRWSALDHVVASREALHFLAKVRVNRNYDDSDHWPVQTYITGQGLVEPGAPVLINPPEGLRPRMNGAILREKRASLASHNRWQVFADMLDEEEAAEAAMQSGAEQQEAAPALVERVTEAFVGVAHEVAGELGALVPPLQGTSQRPTRQKTARARRAINKRRKLHRKWVQLEAPRELHVFQELQAQVLVAKVEMRRSSKVMFSKHVAKGMLAMGERRDVKALWKWVNGMLGRGRGTSMEYSGPLRNSHGVEVYSSQDKLGAWAQHYADLLRDVTGHSKDEEYWRDILQPEWQDELEGMDMPFSWPEVNRSLKHMKNGTAPGLDGIPPEFFKAVTEAEADEQPESALGRVLLRVLNILYDKGVVPVLMELALLVSIPKKGDLSYMDNYRGISLICVLLKLVTRMWTQRVQGALEERGWFKQEQAGFRKGEECMCHVVALYELLRRRALANKRTYVTFVDFRKAYDTVPHEAMLIKAEAAGVRGKALRFLRGLYANSRVSVRTPFGYSDPVVMGRGVRQGCPASTLLYLIFCNDLPQLLRRQGLTLGPTQEDRLGGLAYADDLAGLCSSTRRLRRSNQVVTQWAALHEIEINARKSAVMGFGNGAMQRLRESPDRWRLGGEVLSVVEEYTYLGVVFNHLLDLDQMALHRMEKGAQVTDSIGAMLRSLGIPLYTRIMLVRSLVIPVLTYGAELWGMHMGRVARHQTVLNKALKWVLGIGVRNHVVSGDAIMEALGVTSVFAHASAARARGFVKFTGVKTVVRWLRRGLNRQVGRAYDWLKTTKRFMTMIWRDLPQQYPGVYTLPMDPEVEYDGSDARVVATQVRIICAKLGTKRNESSTWRRVNGAHFEFTRSYLFRAMRFPSHIPAVQWLTRFRAGAVMTAKKLHQWGLLPDEYEAKCPCCGEAVPETIQHMMVECSRWTALRQLHHIMEMLPGEELDTEQQSVILLGGRVARGPAALAPVNEEGQDAEMVQEWVFLQHWVSTEAGHTYGPLDIHNPVVGAGVDGPDQGNEAAIGGQVGALAPNPAGELGPAPQGMNMGQELDLPVFVRVGQFLLELVRQRIRLPILHQQGAHHPGADAPEQGMAGFVGEPVPPPAAFPVGVG